MVHKELGIRHKRCNKAEHPFFLWDAKPVASLSSYLNFDGFVIVMRARTSTGADSSEFDSYRTLCSAHSQAGLTIRPDSPCYPSGPQWLRQFDSSVITFQETNNLFCKFRTRRHDLSIMIGC